MGLSLDHQGSCWYNWQSVGGGDGLVICLVTLFKVGSGTGAVCRHLAKLPGIQSVLGVDPSPLLVEKSETLGGGPE